MAEIVLINPRFEISYWGLEHALPILGKRANMPIASLPLLAALTPVGGAKIRLVHGEPAAAEALTESLREQGVADVRAPELGEQTLVA